MSATNPLREIADELRALGEEWRGEWPDGRVCKAELNRLADRLAAVPAEPGRNDERAAFLAGEGTLTVAGVADWYAEIAHGPLVACGPVLPDTPLMVSVEQDTEPEAWEYRVCRANGRAIMSNVEDVDLAWRFAAPDGFVDRRRPGTAPGEWERVDPEPREGRVRCICAWDGPDECGAEKHHPVFEPRPQDGGEQ